MIAAWEEGVTLRDSTRETIARVVREMRGGKSPKEIAYSMGLTHSAVKTMIHRHSSLRAVFVETYGLRQPHSIGPPPKIVEPLRRIVT